MQIRVKRDGMSGMAGRCAASMAALATVLAAEAFGQSEQELRQENQALNARVQQLEAELDAARAQIEQLTEANAALAAQIRDLRRDGRAVQPAGPQPQPQPEAEVTVDESIPNASPRALFNAVSESYRRSMEDFGDVTTADDKERIRAMRALQKWAASVNRDLKSQIEWHVRPNDIHQLDDSPRLRVSAVDPKTGAVLGDSFDLALTDAQIGRLRRALLRQPQEVLVLRGVLTPQIAINDQRPVEGPFNNPPFIGPYAEFGYSVQVTSLVPAVPVTAQEGGAKPSEKEPANADSPPPQPTDGK